MAHNPALKSSVIYEGGVPPSDSLLFYAKGFHTGLDNASTLTDANAAFGTDTFNNGFTVRNASKGETADITDTTNTTLVGPLSGGEVWDNGNAYQVYVTIEASDIIYYSPKALGMDDKVVSFQLYDDSDGTYSDTYEYTLENTGATFSGGDVSVSTLGVVTITMEPGGGGDIGGSSKRRERDEEVRRASELALRRRRKREQLEAQRKAVINQATVETIDASLKKAFKIDAKLEALHQEILEHEIQAAQRRQNRRKRDKLAILLLTQ